MHFDAAIFDMDGVITKTAAVHCTAWKQAFDEFLKSRSEPFREFSRADYLAYVDGRPRYKGVALFLQSRNVALPLGDPDDAPDRETVCGLGNRKNARFNAILERDGVEVFASTILLIEDMRRSGIRVAVATSSKNSAPVLERAEIADLFDACMDGNVATRLGLTGKPEPDVFLATCISLGAVPERTVVVEDAISGVEAAARGEFGLTLGVARDDNHEELVRYGADLVVSDLSEISLKDIDSWFATKQASRRARCQ